MPKKRIPPSQALSKEILELVQNLTEAGSNNTILTKPIEMSIRKTIQEIREKEASEYIGKACYESGRNRNGYKPAHIRTAECKIPIRRPQVREYPAIRTHICVNVCPGMLCQRHKSFA